MSVSLDLSYVSGFVFCGNMEPIDDVVKDWMVNAGMMLSGGH